LSFFFSFLFFTAKFSSFWEKRKGRRGLMHKGSRGIIVAVQVGAVKIYIGEQWRCSGKKKERQGETQETIKID
jgi:membrane protein implicated in regulation of membrane protease activity